MMSSGDLAAKTERGGVEGIKERGVVAGKWEESPSELSGSLGIMEAWDGGRSGGEGGGGGGGEEGGEEGAGELGAETGGGGGGGEGVEWGG